MGILGLEGRVGLKLAKGGKLVIYAPRLNRQGASRAAATNPTVTMRM